MNCLPELLLLVSLFALGVPLSVRDASDLRVPNVLVLGLLISGAVINTVSGRLSPFHLSAGVLAGPAALLLARATTEGRLGWGDVKLSAGVGAHAGWPGTLVALAAASVLGAADAFLSRKERDIEARIAFGPYLIGGAVIQMIGEVTR